MLQLTFHHTLICIGGLMNLFTIYVILLKTPKSFKEYSYLLLNDSLIELLSVITHFIVNGRSITALCFWYRMRTLQEKGSIGVCRLQMICILFFLPHIPSIIVFVRTISPKTELENIVDEFYQKGYASEFGLYGYSRITELGPLLFATYMMAFPFSVFSYVGITRYRLLSILREKSINMSEKTKSTHASLAKALTIHSILPVFVTSAMTTLIIAQLFFGIHSSEIESLEYDIAVLPTLVNPWLTLYFVRPYR
ncbi:hypothetical protein PRIPAC_82096, partial [Pristionchus pacificus]|uniref:G protein-coupled receptor n=1 Tax=Pristionchus pacificus TaxID=54126 RepID=A0A2A6C3G3_PRIPA